MRLILEQVRCQRGPRIVLAGVDIAVGGGHALIVTGPNGSGKSTLLRVVAGLLTAESGSVRLEGGVDDRSIGEQAHFVGHLDAVKPALTVAENLAFWREMLGGAGPISSALDAVGLAPLVDLPASALSAGQRRRLALARLLVAERPLWLLDEPTTALDAASQERLISLVQAHLLAGGIAVIATHSELPVSPVVRLDLGAVT